MASPEPEPTPPITPERWLRVKEVLHQAWEQTPGERQAFVDRICADDPALRSQVQQLLDSDENLGEFMAVPAIQQVPEDSGELTVLRRVGPYCILREIGHGGMGTVYLAERADGEYRKQVAIKLVRHPLAADEILRRFRNERQVLAVLEHPNIARLMDGGATREGLPYLVMEYVDGVCIDTWCDGRKLPVRDRLVLFRKVCDAVQFAHDKQVIHRDLKPANILVTADGTPKLLDFGIAKVLDPKLSDSPETTVGPGPMTPEYASPEQVRGERVAPATDIYSLGVVLYRLLTGVICGDEPLKPSAVAPGMRRLSGDLDNIVLKALRKEPERRYSSVAQFSEDVDRFLKDLTVHARPENLPYRARKFLKRNRVAAWAAAITALLILGLVAGYGRLTRTNPNAEGDVRSIAVLPLKNLSGDRDQEYFADGVTDALIGELARIRALRVISRTSVMSYKGVRKRLPDIARSLGVQTIAEGTVLRAGNRVRIAVRLVDAPNDRPIWNGNYEGDLQNVLVLQSEVAAAIAAEIDVTLTTPDQARVSRSRRIDLGAYDAYLKGRHQYLAEFSEKSLQKAITSFQQALSIDPGYAPAYAGLANCYYMVSNMYYPPMEMMPKARWAALKAIELDDSLGEAHATLGYIRTAFEFNRAEAEKEAYAFLRVRPPLPLVAAR